ncbi:MAG: 3-hydroxyacyl-ACP dehydratase FabZ family protein [Gemmataceae bacterium]
MPPEVHYDLGQVDLETVIEDRDGIRALNPQRFELEQLDAIVLLDTTNHVLIGYKDVRADEFWVRGHMPGYPLFPGVLLCEAAAQLCSYYISKTKLLPSGDFMGFAGLENVRFRSPVHPGVRLVLVAKASKLHRRQCVFNVQAFVGPTMVFHGDIIGVPMHKAEA